MKQGCCAVMVCVATILSSGCGRLVMSSNSSDNLTASASLPFGYQETYRHALAFAHQCHDRPGHHQWNAESSGSIYTDNQTAEIHVQRMGGQGGGDWELFKIKAIPSGSEVEITVANTPSWRREELDAALDSVKSGTPKCYWEGKAPSA
jgi:hypothetical protein